MKVLVLNCGSSSVKFKLLEMADETELAGGIVEEIGHASQLFFKTGDNKELTQSLDISSYEHAIQLVLDTLLDKRYGVIGKKTEISAIGHRVVHGGPEFDQSTLITEQVIKAINAVISLSPLHNPPNLEGISACQKLFPDTPQVAVFDTAYGARLPQAAYDYAIPEPWKTKHHIRRYGFHGTSHSYVSSRAAEIVQQPLEALRIISCHLGSGASVCATQNGRCVETSMGFTPLEGLVMSTRSGDIDPAIIPFIAKHEGLSVEEIDTVLNRESGLKALCGTTDFRVAEENAKNGDSAADCALRLYAHRVKKYIGAYMCLMGGLDVLIFTAGVGEHSAYIRGKIVFNLNAFGLLLDHQRNERNDLDIGKGRVKVLVIPTNEELAIARDTRAILDQSERGEKLF
ncbi:MAG: acetate kinase [candidate division KSB1 bacterium]|nr:acetate kinase [candidate division KSB1 bacterium]